MPKATMLCPRGSRFESELINFRTVIIEIENVFKIADFNKANIIQYKWSEYPSSLAQSENVTSMAGDALFALVTLHLHLHLQQPSSHVSPSPRSPSSPTEHPSKL